MCKHQCLSCVYIAYTFHTATQSKHDQLPSKHAYASSCRTACSCTLIQNSGHSVFLSKSSIVNAEASVPVLPALVLICTAVFGRIRPHACRVGNTVPWGNTHLLKGTYGLDKALDTNTWLLVVNVVEEFK